MTEQQMMEKSSTKRERIQETIPELGKSKFTTSSGAYEPWMIVEKRNRWWSKEKKTINGVAREKMQENIRLQLLETLNDKMGSHENRPTKEINMTQKELGSAEESIAAQTRTPHW